MKYFVELVLLLIQLAFLMLPQTEPFLRSLVADRSWRVAALRIKQDFLGTFDRLYQMRPLPFGLSGPSLGRVTKIGLGIVAAIVILPFALQVADLFLFLHLHGLPDALSAKSQTVFLAQGPEFAPMIPRTAWAEMNGVNGQVYDELFALAAVIVVATPIILLFLFIAVVKTRLVGRLLVGKGALASILLILAEILLSLNLAGLAMSSVANVSFPTRAYILCRQTPYGLGLGTERGSFVPILLDCNRGATIYTYGDPDRILANYAWSPDPRKLGAMVMRAETDLTSSFDLIALHRFYDSFGKVTFPTDALFHSVFNVGFSSLSTGPKITAAAAAFTVLLSTIWFLIWTLLGGMTWLAGKQAFVQRFVERHRGHSDMRALIMFLSAPVLLLALAVDWWNSSPP